jgi:hypothetical protein
MLTSCKDRGMILHCEEPVRKKRRFDVIAAGQEEQPAFDQLAFDQPVALSGSVRVEVATEASTGTISARDCERKSILIPSDDAHNLMTHDRSLIFFNSIVASQFHFGTS